MSITVRQLDFSFGDLPVLRGVNAEVRPGCITAVLGPNAAGKTTLLRCVVGALRPQGGEVLIDGRPAHRLRGAALAARLAYISQQTTVSAAFSVREVVELGRFALEASPRRIDEALESLELTDLADRPFPLLSAGQQQRVAFARAVAQLSDRGHLVLDEPTSAMDLRHARDCFSLLRRLADKGVTVLIAIHDLSAAASFADEAWLLDPGPPGTLDASGSAAEVLQVERLERLFGIGFEWGRRADGSEILLAESRPVGSAGRIGQS